MKILHLRSSEFYGSPERLIIGQCLHLKEFQHVCGSFVRPGAESRFLEECEKAGIYHKAVRESHLADLRTAARIGQLIDAERVDLLVSHDYKANFYGRMAAKRRSTPQIAYFHGLTSEGLRMRLYNRIDRHVLRKIGLVITVSEVSKSSLVERGVPESRIRVVYNAIDHDSLTKHPKRESSGQPYQRIVAAGRFSHEKGLDILLEAIARIKESAPPFQLYPYGHGVEENNLKQMVSRLGLGDIVEFSGFVDDILPILADMDFMVMPSRSEGMPVAILEAWSQELGVVATSVGGVPEMIQSGQNGLLVDPEDPGALADRMLWALNHPEAMRSYGKAGYKTIGEKFTFEIQAAQLSEIYTEAAGASR